MTAIETLDDAYATIAEKADDGSVTQQERAMLLHAAADVAFRKRALEMLADERERREMIRFGPVGPLHVFGPAGAVLAG